MSSPSTFRIFAACCTAVALAGCGAGEPFTYEDAMNVMRDRSDAVRISFSASPRLLSSDIRLAQAYQKLLDGRLIQCKDTPLGPMCEPGPAGDALKQESATELSLVAGKWAPSAVVSLQRTGRNTASADIRMTFEPSEAFRDFGDALDVIQPPGYMVAQASWKQGKVVHATFQHFEDGWHVDSVTE